VSLKGKVVGVAVVAALAIGVFTAGASSAAAATWNPSNVQMKQTGTLTFTLAGGSPKVCAGAAIVASAGGGAGSALFTAAPPTKVTCADGSWYSLWYEGAAVSSTSLFVGQPSIELASPYGFYRTAAFFGTWTNGNAVTPSKLTFTNALIGKVTKTNQEIRVSGTLDVTTAAGGLMKLE
jgi:hypothetical protein